MFILYILIKSKLRSNSLIKLIRIMILLSISVFSKTIIKHRLPDIRAFARIVTTKLISCQSEWPSNWLLLCWISREKSSKSLHHAQFSHEFSFCEEKRRNWRIARNSFSQCLSTATRLPVRRLPSALLFLFLTLAMYDRKYTEVSHWFPTAGFQEMDKYSENYLKWTANT